MPVGSSWLFLATVIDICSRRVVGWSIANHTRTDLVTDAIEMTVHTRGGTVRGVIFHRDHGSQYTAATFADVCRHHGIHLGRVRVGSCDIAMAEAFNTLFKAECIRNPVMRPHGGWRGVGDVEWAFVEYID